MSSPRLLVLAVMALGSAALPASGMAALNTGGARTPVPVGYGEDVDGNALWTADNVLSPGETVNVNFPLLDDGVGGSYPDDAKGQLSFQGDHGAFLSIDRPNPSAPFDFKNSAGAVLADPNIPIKLSPALQCGVRVPMTLTLGGQSQGPMGKTFTYDLPTGGVGAYRRTPSRDVGNIIYDGQSKESRVEVTQSSLLKGLRVHIDQIDHRYSTYWLKLTLVAPSGKEAVLINQQGGTQGNSANPNRQFHNLTFSSTPVNGQAPIAADEAALQDFSDVVVAPKDSFDIFDGEAPTGTWKLRVTDISAPLEARRLRLGRSGDNLSGSQMVELGGWGIDTAGPVCSPAPGTAAAGPDAWFGTDPLIINPDGDTINAGASVDASIGGSVAQYVWDLDGNPTNGADGFETTLGTPTATLPGPITQGKRTIRLKVVDNDGKVSSVVTREAFITKPPVITSVTANPNTIMAGTEVTLTAAATDPDLPSNASLTYEWDLNDDGVFGDAVGPVVKKTWPTSGMQMVRVRVTDDVGASTIRNERLNVSNLPPTARLVVKTVPAIVNEDVVLDGSTSTDSDGQIVKYEWNLDGNEEFDDFDSTKSIATAKFTTPGTHQVSLRVLDNTGGTDTITLQVDVTGRPLPEASASPNNPLKGETVTFSAAGSRDSDATGSIVKYEWDLDGNNSFEISGATTVSATKAYPNAGTVVAKLRVTDNSGATALALIPITVRNPDAVIVPTTPPGNNNGNNGNNGKDPGTGKGPGGETNPPGLVNVPPGVTPAPGADPFGEDLGAGDSGETDSGFIAKIQAGSKAKGKKVYKKGIAVALTANDAGNIVLKAMIQPKDAKKLGLKIKKPTAIGSGKLVLTKAGKGKFTVVFAKKFQRYVKKGNKTPLDFRAVVTSKSDGSQLVLARKFTLVK